MSSQEQPLDPREIGRDMVPITRFEQSLQVLKSAFEQWVKRCGSRAGLGGFASIEIQVLHIIGRAQEPRRIVDICFVLNIEDAHIVNYAVKKLVKGGLVRNQRSGKDVVFTVTPEGAERMADYARIKRQFLVEASATFPGQDIALEELSEKLHLLAAIYEQAARKAETNL